jgi:hypothetical protein
LEKVEGEVCVLPPHARARKLEIGHGDEGSRAMSEQGDGMRDGTREERLKAALRENLRRRKAQMRGREAAETDGPAAPADRPPRMGVDG